MATLELKGLPEDHQLTDAVLVETERHSNGDCVSWATGFCTTCEPSDRVMLTIEARVKSDPKAEYIRKIKAAGWEWPVWLAKECFIQVCVAGSVYINTPDKELAIAGSIAMDDASLLKLPKTRPAANVCLRYADFN